MLNIVITLNKIKEICKEKNYEFLGFKDGEYKNNESKLILKCNNCGNIWNTTSYGKFIKGQGCRKCLSNKQRMKLEDVISNILNKCKEKNYEFLNFKDGEYKNNETKLILKCNNCGNIWDTTSYRNFMFKNGCPKCGKTAKISIENILQMVDKHCKKYNMKFLGFFDKDGNMLKEFNTSILYIKFKCNNCGNVWLSSYASSIRCDSGCPKCNNGSSMEDEICNKLKELGIVYVLHDRKTLKGLELDFYIPSKNIAIECQGIQHFKSNPHFGGDIEFEKRILNDNKKRQLCEEKGIKLLYFSNLHIDYPYKVYESIDEIIKNVC